MTTELFARVPRERLKAVLENLHAFTGLPIRLIDNAGEPLMTFGESPFPPAAIAVPQGYC